MVAETPIWSTWTNRLPNRPLAADVLADGVYRRPREQALQYAHIEFNTRGRLGWLVFDQDTDESFECWERANLPAPNFYSQNRSNGHGHLGYCLKTPHWPPRSQSSVPHHVGGRRTAWHDTPLGRRSCLRQSPREKSLKQAVADELVCPEAL
jgi:hypothetical protein